MKEIPLPHGLAALVDDEDYPTLSAHKWHLAKGYAVRNNYTGAGPRTVSMHRTVLGLTDPKVQADHANGVRLDNRRANLRACTARQNCLNRPRVYRKSAGYRGVYRHHNKFRAIAKVGGVRKHLGLFTTEIEAARAYDAAASGGHGQFAVLNGV